MLELRGIEQSRFTTKYTVKVTLDSDNGLYQFELPKGPLLDVCGEKPANPVSAPVDIVCELGEDVTIG
jgi:hypothetical protein